MSGSLGVVRGFVQVDLLTVARDRFLWSMLTLLGGIAVLIRVTAGWVRELLLDRQGFDLATLHPLIGGYVSILLAGMLIGTVGGFVMLEQRESGTLRAQLVTPVPFRLYLGYRVALPVALSFVAIPPMAWLVDLALPPAWMLIPLAAAGSLFAGIVALFIATTAQNKVQAFALSKIVSSTGLIPIAAWFVGEPWGLLAGVYPPYWVQKAYWEAGAGPQWGLWLLLGGVGQLVLIGLMVRRFRTIAYR